MKISITTKECKSKNEDALSKGYLCFRLRDKGVDLKVRSDIEVIFGFWDNDPSLTKGRGKYQRKSRNG